MQLVVDRIYITAFWVESRIHQATKELHPLCFLMKSNVIKRGDAVDMQNSE